MINYNIISTGSKGNSVLINKCILIDVGVSFKALSEMYQSISVVLLTHIHSDHFNKTTIKLLAETRPTIRFACCNYLIKNLIECGVKPHNIDVLKFDEILDYGIFKIIPFYLTHNVPNCGFKIHFLNGEKLIYATDTNDLNGVSAVNYDLYMIEANYEEEELQKRLNEKIEKGEYAYEMKVINNHLSKSKCDDFLYKNMGPHSKYIYMHTHDNKEYLDE